MAQITLDETHHIPTMSGNELIRKLSELSPEQRELPVLMEGEECHWTLDVVEVIATPDHINGEYLELQAAGQVIALE